MAGGKSLGPHGPPLWPAHRLSMSLFLAPLTPRCQPTSPQYAREPAREAASKQTRLREKRFQTGMAPSVTRRPRPCQSASPAERCQTLLQGPWMRSPGLAGLGAQRLTTRTSGGCCSGLYRVQSSHGDEPVLGPILGRGLVPLTCSTLARAADLQHACRTRWLCRTSPNAAISLLDPSSPVPTDSAPLARTGLKPTSPFSRVW
jgi:hypothetical protein